MPMHSRPTGASRPRQGDLPAEDACLLRVGSTQHHVGKIRRDRGVGFMVEAAFFMD